MNCSMSGSSVLFLSPSFLKFMSIESVMLSNHLTFCHSLLLLPSIFLSIMVFSNELVLHIRWPKYWSFTISPFNEYSGLISFRIDWFDLLAVQGILKSLLQHHSSKASIVWCPAFFMAQLSHLNMTIGKNIASTIRSFIGKVMFSLDKFSKIALLFNSLHVSTWNERLYLLYSLCGLSPVWHSKSTWLV